MGPLEAMNGPLFFGLSTGSELPTRSARYCLLKSESALKVSVGRAGRLSFSRIPPGQE
jgi:hypothetical protein